MSRKDTETTGEPSKGYDRHGRHDQHETEGLLFMHRQGAATCGAFEL